MAREPRKLQITRQQQHVLLLALFLLKHILHQPRPEKRQVINFIRIRKLILIREEDRQPVSTGEEAWENSLAWQRSVLRDNGSLAMPERGIWQITLSGEDRLLEWCAIMHGFVAKHANWENCIEVLESIFEEKIAITKETVLGALEAYEFASRLFPERIPNLADDIKGRIKL